MQKYKSKTVRAVEVILVLGFAIATLATILWWLGEHDKILNEWAVKYEECVEVEYHTTPSAWYAEHGEYPPCEIGN